MTRRETIDLGKSIFWNDEVKIRIDGVSSALSIYEFVGEQVRE